MLENDASSAIAQELGLRLKQARLNADFTQRDLAEKAGVSRKVLMAAEQGKSSMVSFIAIMSALDLLDQIDTFLAPQMISPLQLAKLQGKQRQRASGSKNANNSTSNTANEIREPSPQW